ncbi:vesicle transport protein SFT2B-like [Populus alba x Populus x berolinensis]|nr:vesicle transport protein SFT2B-like [Populus alba x Populus x berolinensis]
MWKLNQFIPDDDGEREESLLEEESDGICSLSPTQRMYAFAASLAAGLILMFLSLIVFAKPIKFALLFTFGNVLAVGRYIIIFAQFSNTTAFLIGPGRQLGMMFDPIRIYATVIYIGCVILALIFALLIHSKILTVFAIIFEICALIWYGLSYIPFARRMVSSLMIRLFDTEL